MYKKLKRVLKISIAVFFLIIAVKLYLDYKNIDLADYTSGISLDMLGFGNKHDNSDYKILDIKNLNQNDGYPTGCESVSAVMMLKYYGYTVSVEEFINGYLNTAELKLKDGKLYGPSPYEYYIGNPTKISGYGCFAPVITDALERFVEGKYTVKDLTGTSLDNIARKYIKEDIPVMLWVSIDMRQITEGRKWIIESTNEDFTWPSGEHCMVLVGYDAENYYLNDPYNNNGLVKYEKSLVNSVYESLGSQAIVLIKN